MIIIIIIIIIVIRGQLTTLEEKYSTLKRLNKQLLTATDTYESILKRRDSSV